MSGVPDRVVQGDATGDQVENPFETVSIRKQGGEEGRWVDIRRPVAVLSSTPTATRYRDRPGPCHASGVPYHHGWPQDSSVMAAREGSYPRHPPCKRSLLGFHSHLDDRKNKPGGFLRPPTHKSCLSDRNPALSPASAKLPLDKETWRCQNRGGLSQTLGSLIELTQRGGASREPSMHTGAPLRLRWRAGDYRRH